MICITTLRCEHLFLRPAIYTSCSLVSNYLFLGKFGFLVEVADRVYRFSAGSGIHLCQNSLFVGHAEAASPRCPTTSGSGVSRSVLWIKAAA